MPSQSVPDAGDIVWVEFDPVVGRDQRGRRPAFVISGVDYNSRSTYVVVCPITRSSRAWPFKVEIPQNEAVNGFIIVDQIKSVDRVGRVVGKGPRLPAETLKEVRMKLEVLLGLGAAAREPSPNR